MLDFTKIFNIVFISVCAALILFLLISVIVVAAKGKRKCGAFDVILRILSTLVFIAALAMVAASVLTMLNTVHESMCIVVAQENDVAAAWLVMFGEIIELPLPELFVALSTVIGFGISALLFILSMTALIVDCLVANKKSDKKQKREKQQKPPNVKKTPEQLKREAELERIKRIGESAVRKTSSVASADKHVQTEQIGQKVDKDGEPKTEPAPEQNAEPDFDWRAEPKETEQPAPSFVGIKDEQDDFDSFDSFDSFDTEPDKTDEQPEQVQAQDDFDSFGGQPEQVQAQDDFDSFGGQPEQDEQPREEQDDFDLDNIVEQSDSESEDEYVNAEEESEEQPYSAEDLPEEQPYADDEQPEVYDDEQQGEDEYVEPESAESEQEPEPDDDMSAWQFEMDAAQNADAAENFDEVENSDEIEEADEIDAADIDENTTSDGEKQIEVDEPVEQSRLADSGIEPDRGIYIPKMRTVTRGAAGTPTQRPTPVRQSVAKPATKPAAKPVTKGSKPAAKKPTAKPKRGGGNAQKPAAASSIPPEKKLPVTRRYVILDRHNAVNMFGEYLKERNQAEKDKLKSSINTIIIE